MTEQEWLNEFSDNLKSLLKDALMTQRELADDTNLSESVISDYVNGRKLPGIRSILNISYSLDCDLHDLIDFGERID